MRINVRLVRDDDTVEYVTCWLWGRYRPATRTDPECWPTLEIEDEERFSPSEREYLETEAMQVYREYAHSERRRYDYCD